MSLLSDLIELPPGLSASTKFTSLNGILYMSAGALLLTWPSAVQTLLLDPEFVGREAELMRILGLTVAIIGWFYFFGGRSGGRQVVAATVLDRIVLVPLVLVPIAMTGVFPHMFLLFAILDPLLGLVAWYLLTQDKRKCK